MLKSDGRVVMVSGASRGIGRAVAQRLLDAGYGLSLGARDPGVLADLVDDNGSRVLAQPFDALDPRSNSAWVEATLARFGRIDGLVNNAGIYEPVRVEDDDEAAYDRLWAVNVKGPLRMIRLCLPHLRQAGSGRIVNIASLSGKRIANDAAGYAMSKFAVMALTHAARHAAWEDGVRATAVCPGMTATDMTARFDSVAPADMSQPEDVAELVAVALALPNTAVVPELLVNCRLENIL